MSEEVELPPNIEEVIRNLSRPECTATIEEVRSSSPSRLFIFSIGLINSNLGDELLITSALSCIANILTPTVANSVRKIQLIVDNFGENKEAIYSCLINLIQSESEVIRNLAARILAFYFKIEYNNLDIFQDLFEVFSADGATEVSQFGALLTMCEIVTQNILKNSYRRIKTAVKIMYDCFCLSFQNEIEVIQPIAIKLFTSVLERPLLKIGITGEILNETQAIVTERMPNCEDITTYQLWCDLIKNFAIFKKKNSLFTCDIQGIYNASRNEIDVYSFLNAWYSISVDYYKMSNIKTIPELICENICEIFLPLIPDLSYNKEDIVDGAFVGKDIAIYQILAVFVEQTPELSLEPIHDYISEITSGDPTVENLISVLLMSIPLNKIQDDDEDAVALYRDMISLFIENRADTIYQSSELLCYFLMVFAQSITECNILMDGDFLDAVLTMVKDELLAHTDIIDDTAIELALNLIYSIAKRFSNDEIDSYLGDNLDGLLEIFDIYSTYLLENNNSRLFELLCNSMYWIARGLPFNVDTTPILVKFFELFNITEDPSIKHAYALVVYGLIESTHQDIGEFLISTVGPAWVSIISEVNEDSTDYINYIWGMFHIVDHLRQDALVFFDALGEKLHELIGFPQPDVVRAAAQLVGHFLLFGGENVSEMAPEALATAIEILGSPSTLTRSAQGMMMLACSAIIAHGEEPLDESAFHILDYIFDYADSLQSLYNEDQAEMVKLLTASVNVVSKILEKCADVADSIPWSATYNEKEISIFDLIPVIIIEISNYVGEVESIPQRFLLAALSGLDILITSFSQNVMKIINRREITNMLREAKANLDTRICGLANTIIQKRDNL